MKVAGQRLGVNKTWTGSDQIDKTRTGSDRIDKTWIGLLPIDKTRTGSEKGRIVINFRQNSHVTSHDQVSV